MRKMIALLAVGAIALAACGDDGGSSGTEGEFTPIKKDTLTVVTSLPGPGFWNGSESDPTKITDGYEYDMAKLLQEKLGMKNLEVRNENFDAIVAGQAGEYDLALSQVTITDERAKVVDFTTPYFASDQGVFVKAGTKVPDLAAAKKLLWGVQTATTGLDFVTGTIKPDKEPQVFQSLADAFTALTAGQVDAVMMDTAIVLAEAAKSGGKLEVAGQFKTGESYGGILPKGSKNKTKIDEVIKGLETDGTLGKLAEKYLGGDPSKVPVIPVG